MLRKIERPAESFEERCAAQANEKLARAAMLPLGAVRTQLEREAWELQIASQIRDYLSLGSTKPAT